MQADFNEFELNILDDYLAKLQSGKPADRREILRDYPHLESSLNCLDALQRLVPPQPQDFNYAGEDQIQDKSPEDNPLKISNADSTLNHLLPREFGRYELLAELGRGGMGVVYKARQTDLDRIVAIKMILAGNLASPEHVRRFRIEAKAAARLRHSHIVQIHEVGQLNGQDFFSMEYIEGRNLADWLAHGVIDPREAARIIAALARAVDYLHQKSIVHRDLKPSNVMLDEAGEPYLTDFGLAKFFVADGEKTATGVIAGTPSYMAPEQAMGRHGTVGPAADIYSLGAILYELLTGQPPFRDDNPLDTLLNVLSVDPELPRKLNPKIPRPLELICLRCLEKNPLERYSSAEKMADDLERFLRSEPISLRPPTMLQRFWGWTRRQPALASRLGALTLFWSIDFANAGLGAGRLGLARPHVDPPRPLGGRLDRLPTVRQSGPTRFFGVVHLGNVRLHLFSCRSSWSATARQAR